MFKLEPIVDSNLDIWGYEALLSLNVPNPYIFAVPNPVLELYLFETFIKTHQEHLKDKRFTFNLSVFAVVIGAENLKKLLKEHPNLYIEITESAFLPSNPENEWFQLLRSLLKKFPNRFLLDDYMEGKTTFLYQLLKNLWFAVKISSPVLKQIQQIAKFNNTLIIAEKIETEEDFSLLKTKANLFQGFYFKSVLK